MQKNKINKKYLFLFLLSFVIIILISLYLKDRLLYLGIRNEKRPISYLSFDDLLKLRYLANPQGNLYHKLQKQLLYPYVFNYFGAGKPRIYKPYVRLAHWNIERGMNLDIIKILFTNHQSYYYNFKNNIDNDNLLEFKNELNVFAGSDVISLNEVDIGMPRTKYKNVVAELAEALHYNYAFATEFIELDPLFGEKINVDPQKYIGLHGNAVLSRYPIKSAQIVRLPQMYKWYETEIRKKSPLENARRMGAKTVFNQEILSEVRHGSRCALIVDIELPTREVITVVSTHLEDRCYPDGRFKQVQYLFENIKYLRKPVVIAGDFNTSTTDAAPTSFKKEIVKRLKDPHFIARQAVLFAIPGLPLAGNLIAGTLSKVFQYKDPAALSIPVLFPNQERKLFNYIKDFKFADGEGFDIRGESAKSANGKKGLLANSNERQLKGFESTFAFEEPRVIAYYKLDWFFVKPKAGRFEPFNGQTLQLINHGYKSGISDHEPMTVDLSLIKGYSTVTGR